jgi:hypothetical protein
MYLGLFTIFFIQFNYFLKMAFNLTNKIMIFSLFTNIFCRGFNGSVEIQCVSHE